MRPARPTLSAAALALMTALPLAAQETGPGTGNAIFFHPDGAGVNQWMAARVALVWPDGMLNWDRLPEMGVYTGHMADRLTGTSNGGATVHAYGVKVVANSFGKNGTETIMDGDRPALSLAQQAIAAGRAVALVQTGNIAEPGTAAFVASVDDRDDEVSIALQVIESGAQVILSGGERNLLPKGVMGRHGEGVREDGVNLIERAQELGYTVVYTAEELAALDSATATKVLGVFAEDHTFNDNAFERNAIDGLPSYKESAPTVAQMMDFALQVVSRDPEGFFAVVEEEGTDNMANAMNAQGTLDALERADAAFGVALDFVEANPSTLLLTAADSDAGGMQVLSGAEAPEGGAVRATTAGGGILKGQQGYMGDVFMSAPDANGVSMPFGLAFIGTNDVNGGILVRGAGLNADRIAPLMDNTDVYELMRATMFGPAG